MPDARLLKALFLAFSLSCTLLEAQVVVGPMPMAATAEAAQAEQPEETPATLPYVSLNRFPEEIRSLSLSPTGRQLAVVLGDGGIEIWDPFQRAQRASARFEDRYPREARYLLGGRKLVLSGQGLWVVNARTLALDKGFPWILPATNVTAFDITSDGKTAVVGDYEGSMRVVDLRTGREIHRIQAHKGEICGIRFYAHGNKVASIGVDQTLKLWKTKSLEGLRSLERPYPPDSALGATPDSRWLALGGLRVDFFDTATETEVSTVEAGHRGLEGGLVNALAFALDGAWLASGGCDRIINVWDTRTRRILKTFEGSGDQVQVLAFSRDRKQLFSGDRSGTLAIWDLGGILPR